MFNELDRENFAVGEQIFKVGEAADCAYLIEQGAVGIYVMDQGVERLACTMGKDEMFGEVALIERQPRTFTVMATEKTVLIPIRRRLLDGLLEKSDPILRYLLRVILEHFRNKQSTITRPAPDAEAVPLQSVHRGVQRGEATQQLALVLGITRALAHDEFELYYQPICHLADGRTAGFEALMRWHHPTDGVIQPMDFLGFAEHTGLIHELGLWVLERACRDWPTLRKYTRYESPFVSVNLSPIQLTGKSLVDEVKATIARHNMPAAELKLELTETVMIDHTGIALQILNRLTELGSSLALDDYGTGHSGLDHLQRYPIGTLKIDRAFIEPMLDSAQSMEIVHSSIRLAHSLGMNVVAEGVESDAVREKLLELGCDFGQGWHFGRPATLQEIQSSHTEI